MIQKILPLILVLKLVFSQNIFLQQCLTQVCKLQPQQVEIQQCIEANKQCKGFIDQNLSDCQNMQCSIKCSAYLSYDDQECVLSCVDKIEPSISDECSEFLSETQQQIIENQEQRQETIQQIWVVITVGTIIFSIIVFIIYFVVQLIKKFNKQKKLQSLQGVVVISQSQVNQYNLNNQLKQKNTFPPINNVVIVVPDNVQDSESESNKSKDSSVQQQQQQVQAQQIKINPK